ncbi:MAG: hypothetical protein L6Q53_12970 [Candidatus Brocadia sinica]|nr:hypothetical protein [Candidatus Brocadia sinica]NUO04166.1 hypothetical protein [Candidatus Brocadia sinica]
MYTIGNNFVYDDKFIVVNNYLIRSWHKVSIIFSSDYFTGDGGLSYRPFVTVSYFLITPFSASILLDIILQTYSSIALTPSFYSSFFPAS